jgi:hypothetical protein
MFGRLALVSGFLNARRCVMFFCLVLCCWLPAQATNRDAAMLRARYLELIPELQHNQFSRPIYLNSEETAGKLKGDVYAVVDYPYRDVQKALKSPDQWCSLLMLHLNTKDCRSSTNNGKEHLKVSIGTKHDQAVSEAYQVNFRFVTIAANAEYLDFALNAPNGPMGTSDYKILLEAIPLNEHQTVIHFTYSYDYGIAARLAMGAYLTTIGSDKVGFTRVGGKNGGRKELIGGMRGVAERNTMRYYLAIDAFLSAAELPADQRLDHRLQTWFDNTEHYPRQLHEIEKADYIDMKHREYQRMQNAK